MTSHIVWTPESGWLKEPVPARIVVEGVSRFRAVPLCKCTLQSARTIHCRLDADHPDDHDNLAGTRWSNPLRPR